LDHGVTAARLRDLLQQPGMALRGEHGTA
jgi:hypothetical protein